MQQPIFLKTSRTDSLGFGAFTLGSGPQDLLDGPTDQVKA